MRPLKFSTLSCLVEEFHVVRYTPFAVDAAARLAERQINDRSLPDKAIDLLDEAGSMVKLADDGLEDDLPDDFFVVTDDIIAALNYVRIDPMYSLAHTKSVGTTRVNIYKQDNSETRFSILLGKVTGKNWKRHISGSSEAN